MYSKNKREVSGPLLWGRWCNANRWWREQNHLAPVLLLVLYWGKFQNCKGVRNMPKGNLCHYRDVDRLHKGVAWCCLWKTVVGKQDVPNTKPSWSALWQQQDTSSFPYLTALGQTSFHTGWKHGAKWGSSICPSQRETAWCLRCHSPHPTLCQLGQRSKMKSPD